MSKGNKPTRDDKKAMKKPKKTSKASKSVGTY